MNKIKFFIKNFPIFILLALIFSIPIISLAQVCNGTDPNPSAECCNGTNPPAACSGLIHNPLGPKGPQTINAFIQLVLIGVIKIGFPVIALAIIYCGFLFVKAQGKPEEIKKAKDALLYTVIGAALLLGAWAIAQLIANTITQIKY